MDEFRREVERIAARANGTTKTIDDVFSLVLAADHDTHARFKALERMFEDHCSEAEERDRRLDGLESVVSGCPDRWEEQHARKHEDHMHKFHTPRREGDAAGSDFTEKRDPGGEEMKRKVWALWGVGIFIAVTLANVLIQYLMKAVLP